MKIWENNIKRIGKQFEEEGKQIRCKQSSILRFAKRHFNKLDQSKSLVVWNGRQVLGELDSVTTWNELTS